MARDSASRNRELRRLSIWCGGARRVHGPPCLWAVTHRLRPPRGALPPCAAPGAFPRGIVTEPMLIEYFPDGSSDCPLVLLHGRAPAAVGYLREQICAL